MFFTGRGHIDPPPQVGYTFISRWTLSDNTIIEVLPKRGAGGRGAVERGRLLGRSAVGKEALWRRGAVGKRCVVGCGGGMGAVEEGCCGEGVLSERGAIGEVCCEERGAAGCGGMAYLTISTPTPNNLTFNTPTYAQRSHLEHSHPQHPLFEQSRPTPYPQHSNPSTYTPALPPPALPV